MTKAAYEKIATGLAPKMFVVTACFNLSSCATPAQEETLKIAGGAVFECLKREATSVAPTNTDLETAVQAALARCTAELEADRRAYLDSFHWPGQRRVADRALAEREALYIDFVRKVIALQRAR
jgi:hypothetical protein